MDVNLIVLGVAVFVVIGGVLWLIAAMGDAIRRERETGGPSDADPTFVMFGIPSDGKRSSDNDHDHHHDHGGHHHGDVGGHDGGGDGGGGDGG